MNTIKFDLPALSSTATQLTADVAMNSSTFPVTSTTGIVANDYVLLEERGSELNEILKVQSVTPTSITFTSTSLYTHKNAAAVTKIPYDSFRVYTTENGTTQKDLLTTQTLDYSESLSKCIYDDLVGTATTKYLCYWYNSHTNTEALAKTITTLDTFGWITVSQFRTETGLSSDVLSDDYIIDAIAYGVEFIRKRLFSTQTVSHSQPSDFMNVNVGTLEFTDGNADGQIDVDDIIAVEYDSGNDVHTYVNFLIRKVDARTKKIFFAQQLPRNGRQLFVQIPTTYREFSSIVQMLSTVNKLLTANYILQNNTIEAVRTSITSWTAGGTSIQRDPGTVDTVITANEKHISKLIDTILTRAYIVPTRLRTQRSILNVRQSGTGYYDYYNRR